MSNTLGFGLDVNRGGAGYKYQSETVTLLRALTGTYSTPRKIEIDKMIKSLKAAGVWSKIDVFQMYAAPTAADAVINWKSPGTYNATLVNSPTLEADRGIKCANAGMSINSGFNPTTASINLTLNSATYFYYKTENAGANYDIIPETASLTMRYSTSSSGIRLHSGSGTVTGGIVQNGLHAIVRESSTVVKNYAYNSAGSGLKSEISLTSTNIANAIISVGGSPLYGAANAQFAFFGAGSQLSLAELGNLKDASETYLDYIGAGVI